MENGKGRAYKNSQNDSFDGAHFFNNNNKNNDE